LSERPSIIGFTEAELGFFLALLCLVLLAVAAPAVGTPPEEPETEEVVPADSADRLERRLAAAEQRIDSLRTVLDTLRDRRSRITPSCVERGAAGGPIGTVTIHGPDRFGWRGDRLTRAELLAVTAAERSRARAARCVHQLRVHYEAGLDAASLDSGWRALAGEFRLIRSGAAP
jgi:hypothetical protein